MDQDMHTYGLPVTIQKELRKHCLNKNSHFLISVKNGFLFHEIVSKNKVPAYKWMLSGLYIYWVTKPNLYEKKRKVMNGNCYWTSLHREIHFNFRKKKIIKEGESLESIVKNNRSRVNPELRYPLLCIVARCNVLINE